MIWSLEHFVLCNLNKNIQNKTDFDALILIAFIKHIKLKLRWFFVQTSAVSIEILLIQRCDDQHKSILCNFHYLFVLVNIKMAMSKYLLGKMGRNEEITSKKKNYFF